MKTDATNRPTIFLHVFWIILLFPSTAHCSPIRLDVHEYLLLVYFIAGGWLFAFLLMAVKHWPSQTDQDDSIPSSRRKIIRTVGIVCILSLIAVSTTIAFLFTGFNFAKWIFTPWGLITSAGWLIAFAVVFRSWKTK